LLKEGKKGKAVNVLDRCMELAPNKYLPYDEYISGATYSRGKGNEELHYPGIIEMYYECGEFDKANRILLEHFGILKQDIDYYNSLKKLYKPRFESLMYESRSYINELVSLALKYDQKEVLRQLGLKN
jgi:hypothetical protein